MHDYIDLQAISPLKIQFYLGEFEELGVSIYLEDRTKVVKRTLESNMLAYQGPIMKISSPIKGQELRSTVTLSQILNTEKDEKGRIKKSTLILSFHSNSLKLSLISILNSSSMPIA